MNLEEKIKNSILLCFEDLVGLSLFENSDYIPPPIERYINAVKEISKKYPVLFYTSKDISLVSKWFIENNLAKFADRIISLDDVYDYANLSKDL